MRKKDRKLAVLDQLSRAQGSIALPDLMKKLGNKYAERSVRRWLDEMVKEGLVEKIGQKRATKYAVAKQNEIHCFKPESIDVLEQIKGPIYEREPTVYSYEWVDAYKPNKTFYIPSSLRKQLLEAGNRSKNEEPAGTYAHQIFNRLLIDLSFNSSRLEGNTYSLLDTKRLIQEGKSAEGKLDEEKMMILNHKYAIRYLVDNAVHKDLTTEVIYSLHFLLSNELVEPMHLSGKIRDFSVRIGGSTYIPIEDPKRLATQLERVVKKAAQIKDPYEQSLFLLVHLSYLQAFADVNKRTARLSANIPLIKHNVVPLSFNDVRKEDYTTAIIAVYELRDVRPLVDLYAFSYLRTCAMYDSTVKSLEFDEVRIRYRQLRRETIRNIISKKWVGKKMNDYIKAQAIASVAKENQDDFIQDVLEDLEAIDRVRIAGLGITPSQLDAWKKKYQPS